MSSKCHGKQDGQGCADCNICKDQPEFDNDAAEAMEEENKKLDADEDVILESLGL
jgi:hypothetical protein